MLVVAIAAPATAAAHPHTGAWKGTETSWWTGEWWEPYDRAWPVRFRLSGGEARRFRSTGYIPWLCSDGSEETTKAPVLKLAKLSRSAGKWRLRGTETVSGSRKTIVEVTGSFRSVRRARGRIVVKRQGCGSYRSTWVAKAPKPKRREAR